MAIVVHEEQSKVRKSGRFASGAFQIASTGEAFKILSDKMYSFKIRAVIRELSTNARDSQVAAGTMDTPFKVHLPTFAEQYFSIRDYGIGLSIHVYDVDPIEDGDAIPIFEGAYHEVAKFVEKHEDSDNLFVLDEAMSLYTTYFHSNKIHSNDFVGQLGLGSKSPFAYSDSFEVTVWHNGERRQYQCSIGDDGIPEINYIKQMTTLCDEPSGLEVIIPVKVGDVSDFLREAKYVYARFSDIQPSVNLDDWVQPEINYALVGDDKTWGLRENSTSHELAESNKQYVIMGNIAYPIDEHEVLEHCKSEKAKNLLRMPLDLTMPIGACDIAPSRERLGYKKRTCEAIAVRLEEIVSEMSRVVSEKLEAAESLWDARCLAFEYFYDHDSPLKKVRELADVTKLSWNGNDLKHVAYINIAKIDGVIVNKYTSVEKYDWRKGTNKVSCTQSEAVRIVPGRDVLFYENDLSRGSKSRLMQKVRDEKIHAAYLVTFDNQQAKKNFLLTLGANDGIMNKASKLPKCVYKRKTGTYNKAAGFTFELSGRRHCRRNYEYWEAADVEMDDGGVFVEINRYKPQLGKQENSPDALAELVSRLEDVGFDVPNIIGVRPQAAKAFRKHEDWVDVWDWLMPAIKRYIIANDIYDKLADSIEVKKIDKILLSLSNGFKTTNQLSVFALFVKHYWAMQKNHEEIGGDVFSWQMIISTCGLKDGGKPQYNLDDEQVLVYSTYPLIEEMSNQLYGSSINSEAVKHFHKYIRLLDKDEEENDG
jgi:hypothetical protein